MDAGELSRLAASAVDTLARLSPGMVVAVWPDGSVSTEYAGFLGRGSAGRRIEALVTFPAGSMLSFHEVHMQLTKAFPPSAQA